MELAIRAAALSHCRPIAELAMIAGEGIPAFFWQQEHSDEPDVIAVGACKAASETDNFSYRNAQLAWLGGELAGMLLAYRLPASDPEPLDQFPEFIRPLLELERQVPSTFYTNMLAVYPQFRGRGIGSRLLDAAAGLALQSGCRVLSVQVFEQNEGALRLYERAGFRVYDARPVVPHACHPYTGRLLLLTRDA